MSVPAAEPDLFRTVPSGLFGPLASPNRAHYWRLLCRLFAEFFGPDAPMPPSLGYARREIVQAIERYLLTDDAWEPDAEDGDAAGAGMGVGAALATRAGAVYERFRQAGWLRQERVGAREMVTMTHAVAQLLTLLMDFAERGPAFLGAKVRSIELLLQQVVVGDADGASLDEAAAQSRQLLSYVAAIGVQIRDLMPELTRAESTAHFARQLFERYVGELFVGDYADLHRADHPLARRTAILGMVRELEYGSNPGAPRERLLHWYAERSGGDAALAEQRLQRSLRRLYEIDRIDEYLERLDHDIRQANRRALAYLDYRLRAPDHLDALLRRACRGALAAEPEALRLPVGPGALMHEDRLRPPRPRPQPIPRSANRSAPPTPEQQARLNLQRRMKRARLVLPEDLARYVDRHLGAAARIDSDALAVTSIEDFRAYQTLVTLALRSRRHGGLRREDPLHRMLRGFRIECADDARSDNGYLQTPRFFLLRADAA